MPCRGIDERFCPLLIRRAEPFCWTSCVLNRRPYRHCPEAGARPLIKHNDLSKRVAGE